MLLIIDTSTIQYIIQEIMDSGIEEIVLIKVRDLRFV